jgi:hypothetical protein
MFVFKTTNYQTLEKDSITGKNVIEFCMEVLNYNYQKNVDEINNNYTLKFLDENGNIICEISEDGFLYAIEGESDDASDSIKDESQKFWEMTQSKVNSIEFNNPIHNGDGIWDEDYDEDSDNSDNSDNEDNEDNDEDYEINKNINILS